MNRFLIFIILVLGTAVSVEAKGEPFSWAPPPLAAMIEEALEQNNDIQSLGARVDASRVLIPFAGSLEDLRLGIGLLNMPTDTFDLDQEPMTQKQVFIAQKVPWFGKLDLRSQQQGLQASRQMYLLEAKKLELGRKIAMDYFELGILSKSFEINSKLRVMVGQLLRIAETRYATGVGLQQDIFQAQVELSKLLDEKIVLDKKRRVVEDRINALLNKESFSPIPSPESPHFPDMKLDMLTLKQQALRNNPWLMARLAEVNQADIEIKLAQKDYWPDMDFKIAYGQRDDTEMGQKRADFLSGSIVLKVPIWHKNRQDKKLAASKKKRVASLRSHRNLVETLPHRVDALVTAITELQRNYRLYVDALIVQARQWAQSSQSAYEVGKVNFNTMINAQIRLLRFELKAERYLFQIYQKRAELQEVLGAGPASLTPNDEKAVGPQDEQISVNGISTSGIDEEKNLSGRGETI